MGVEWQKSKALEALLGIASFVALLAAAYVFKRLTGIDIGAEYRFFPNHIGDMSLKQLGSIITGLLVGGVLLLWILVITMVDGSSPIKKVSTTSIVLVLYVSGCYTQYKIGFNKGGHLEAQATALQSWIGVGVALGEHLYATRNTPIEEAFKSFKELTRLKPDPGLQPPQP